METTAEQPTTELTDALTSNDSHDDISATSRAYIQVPVDSLCAQDKPLSENHELAEESPASQLPSDFSPLPPHSSDLNDPEHDTGSFPPIHVADPATNPSFLAAPSGTTTNEGTLQTDETPNASLPPFTSWRYTPHVELVDVDTSDLQIIRRQPSGMTTQLPVLQPCEVDEEAPLNSPLDNALSSSLPPSSSPPQIFSSSPFASSQSSLIETGDDYKVEDRAMIMESDDQDLISPPDVIHPDTVEEPCENDDDHTDADYQQEKHKLEHLIIQGGSPQTNKGPYDNQEQEVNPLPQKRPWSEEQVETLPLHAKDVPPSLEDTRSAKRMKTHDGKVYLPPAPKRATLASQQQQFKKLIAPFRSPLILNKDENTPSEDLSKAKNPLLVLLAPPPAPKLPITPRKLQHAHAAPSVTPAKTRVRTLKAASQFKSPLSSSASASSGRGSSIRLTPTVQSLERKLQLLRRAVKVKENDEEKTLVGLVKKWTEAGREVAYELWDLVNDSANKGDGSRGNGNGFNGTWGWDGGASKGKVGSRDQNWGWDSPGVKHEGCPENEMDTATENLLDEGYINKIHSEDDEQARNTMGTMLRQLGIATETLGWDEDAEVFVN